MAQSGNHYSTFAIGDIQKLGRVTLHDALQLTGAEISINEFPAGAGTPFVHAHQQNEEVYLILKGKGMCYLDGEEFPVAEGDVIRVDPAGARCFRAAADAPLRYACIQTKAGSLVQFTQHDGRPAEGKPSWL
jgi:uncharacterized cupin superfamily protein